MPKPSGMRRIVETHRHSRESRTRFTARFLSPQGLRVYSDPRDFPGLIPRKLWCPGRVLARPSSCGKGPTAVGESVMGLPGSPRDPAARLTGKGSEREVWKTAARVLVEVTLHQGLWESHGQGERRQVRRLLRSPTWCSRRPPDRRPEW